MAELSSGLLNVKTRYKITILSSWTVDYSNNVKTPDLKLKGSHGLQCIGRIVSVSVPVSSLLIFDYIIGATWKPTLSINNKQVGTVNFW